MARARKLTPTAVRAIFQSTDSGPKVAARFHVSTNLVYLIRQGKIHRKITASLDPSPRVSGRMRGADHLDSIDKNILADAIIDRFLARLLSAAGR